LPFECHERKLQNFLFLSSYADNQTKNSSSEKPEKNGELVIRREILQSAPSALFQDHGESRQPRAQLFMKRKLQGLAAFSITEAWLASSGPWRRR